jgi:hypothetical protein
VTRINQSCLEQMPSFPDVLLCGLTALAICGCVGLPLSRRLVAQPALAWGLAPALGWAVFSALALPVLTALGWSRSHVVMVCGVTVVGGAVAFFRGSTRTDNSPAPPIWAFAAAGFLAALPALGIWPKLGDGGLALAAPLFDHSKIAIIDDIVRLGLPVGNPFFGGAEASPGLAYYYLWHFSAAVFAALLGTNGWEADIALTWFTAFASLSLMMGLAVGLSGKRYAAPVVLILSLAGSLAPVLRFLGPDLLGRLLSPTPPPQSWIYQATWIPQHLASACCVVLAVLILTRLDRARVPLLAIVVAAGFESSAWVGGVIFGAAALAIGLMLLLGAKGVRGRISLLAKATTAAVLAAAITYPFLRDELAATVARHLGSPIAFYPYKVFGPIFSDPVRRLLDLPGYWVILLVIALPAIYMTGAAAMFGALKDRQQTPTTRALIAVLALLAAASLGIPWLFASTIANNDLGWDGILPGILVLTAFAAAGLSRWLAAAPVRAIVAIACLAAGIPGGLAVVANNATGLKPPSAAAFAETPEMWAAVRRHTAPDERIANNPLFFADTVLWPVNISWALFANRRSCFAGWNLARAFVPLPEPELDRLEGLFDRVFAGDGSPQDIDEIATSYGCSVVVLTARDGAWRHDPFADNPHFQLVDQQVDGWRIYRVVGAPREAP